MQYTLPETRVHMACARKNTRHCCDEQKERQRFAKVSVDLARIHAPAGPLVLARSMDMPVDAHSYPNALAAMAVIIESPGIGQRLFVFPTWNSNGSPNGVWPSARAAADLAAVLTGACRFAIPDLQNFDKNQVVITASVGVPTVLRIQGSQGDYTVRWPTLKEIDLAYAQGRVQQSEPLHQQRLRRLYGALGLQTATRFAELPLLPLQSFDFHVLRLTPGIFDGKFLAERLSEQLKGTGIYATHLGGQVVFKTNAGRLTIVKTAQTLLSIPMLGNQSPPVTAYALGAPGQTVSQIQPNPAFPPARREVMAENLALPRQTLLNDLLVAEEQWLVPSELAVPLSMLAKAL